MSKTIFPEQGFRIADLLSQDGVMFEMENEFVGFEEENHEYTNDVYMSNDEMIKYLNMDDIDSDEKNSDADTCMPWNLTFDKLRSKMTDLLGNGMVMKFLRREGVGDIMKEDAQVSVRYIGYFEHQDEPFDASYNRGKAPDVLHLGEGAIIPGLEVGLKSMKKHEISVFLIKPEYSYGELGCSPRIPPNQEVLFVVHLIDFSDDFPDNFRRLSIEERKMFCHLEKNVAILIAKAGESFKKGKLKQAIGIYSKASRLLETALLADDEEEERQKKLLTRVYGNLTMCYNKENKPRSACSAFNQIPTKSAKSYFHHARALTRLGEFERAKKELLTSKQMEPKNSDIVKEQKLVKELSSKYNSILERMKANCFLVTGSETVNPEFINAIREFCKTLQNDDNVLRLILPDGLTVDEDYCIRDVAAKYDLSVINHERYGKEIVFVAKSNY